MRVRKLALAVGLVSALGGNAALALGLGEIKLNSTLNQPLDAEIGLLQTRGLGDGEIKVRLASPEDFERAGIDRSYMLTELRFDVDYSGAEPVVRVSSRVPIREPYLNFLLETRWPSGRLLREYTLLMDLPAFSGNTAQQPVRAAERERQQVRRDAPQSQRRPLEKMETRPAPSEEPAERQAETQPQPQQPAEEPVELRREAQPAAESTADSGSQVYGPVSSSETLWEIALENRADREFSVQQTMLAIQRLNPEAFINDNINLLKKGAVLRLPNTEDIRAFSARDAISEVAVQNDTWRQRVGDDAATGAPLDARAAETEVAESESVEGRVSLAAPGDNESVTSGSGSGAGESEALAGELAVTEEELDKSELENEEIKDRISELDEQIDTMERLVEVSNEELEAVQGAAEQTETPPADSMEGAGEETAEAVAEGEEAPAEAVAAAGETDTAPETGAAAEPEETEEVDSRNRVVVQTKPEPTLVDRLMDNIQLIGIGLGALVIGLAGFLTWRRRKEEEEAMRQVEAEMAAERSLAQAPEETPQPEESLTTVEPVETEDNFDLGELDDVGTDDPVSEAEIHLSLGQYSEAEGKLLAGLEKDPNNVDARLMVMEVYAHEQNADKFDDHYRQLLTVSDGPAADRAARLRESIAGAPPFEAPSMDFTSESLEATQLDDISASFEDDFSGGDDLSAAPDSGDGAEDTSLLDDLTMDLSEDSSGGETAAEPNGGDDGDFSLELDLDSSFDSGDSTAEQGDTAENSEDELNLDDLMSGELDLDGLDLNADNGTSGEEKSDELGSIEYESTAASDESGDEGGLDFDLDLSPAEDETDSEPQANTAATPEPAESQAPAADAADDLSDDLENFGDDFGDGLDLDSINLDDIAGELDADESLSAETDTDVAVAEEPRPASRPAAEAGTETATSAESGEADLGDLNFNLESDLDSELNLLEGNDEVSTKLELAQAYLDMGDKDGARDILKEVSEEGSGEHQTRAREMLERMA
ncbi:FimV/HubP family polar landmark protein [Microbulbifer halophilus]|uniref:FimV/HubP family polar landmark protein n=1 Tax=Microbulbifer halophilus TaxID=453963 RepID=A0ABW5EDJ6_9GAMM|nr:FimV/HubP family polar landmark protein [Microbulbifer halophilus]MCW8127051.1 hypothetical protein [Microbulbifer halophilus]